MGQYSFEEDVIQQGSVPDPHLTRFLRGVVEHQQAHTKMSGASSVAGPKIMHYATTRPSAPYLCARGTSAIKVLEPTTIATIRNEHVRRIYG
jgi:hypothetical protein